MIYTRLRFGATSASIRLFRAVVNAPRAHRGLGTASGTHGTFRGRWRVYTRLVATSVAVVGASTVLYQYSTVSATGDSPEDDKTATARLLQKYGLDKVKIQEGTIRAFEQVVSKFLALTFMMHDTATTGTNNSC